jgi:hypothetical protein
MKLLAAFLQAGTHAAFSCGRRALEALRYALRSQRDVWFPCRVSDAGIFKLLWMAFQPERSTGIVSMEKRKGLIPRRDTSHKAFTGRRKS